MTASLVGLTAETAQAALPTGPTTTGVTGSRPNATQLSFPISDRVSAKVDVATGNLLVTTSDFSLVGVNSTVPIGAAYNSRGWQTSSNSLGNGWTFNLDNAGSLSVSSSKVVWTTGDGSTWPFTPGTTTGTYTSPGGLKSALTSNASGYTLTDLTSRQVIAFDTNGNALSVTDRNSNKTTINYNGNDPTSIVAPAGPTAARTLSLGYDSTGDLNMQTIGSSSRSTHYTYEGSSGNITAWDDAVGNDTGFGYSGGHLTSIGSPDGAETDFTYDSTGRITEVDQQNTTAGAAGTSTTRLVYSSSTQTLVAGPDTDTSVAVATGPHTTYALNSAQHLVNSATDPMGRVRAKTYTANADTLTSTAGSGSTASTTTGTYTSNSGQSLNSVTNPGGAKSSQTFGTTASSAYLPASSTDDSGNVTNYTYNGTGNQLTSGTGSGTSAVTSTLTYNTDGTVATALAPGNGTNKTVYGYNSDHQLTSVTPVTGSSLGSKAYTYDAYGRVSTETDGAGNTTTYGYDNDDRVLTTAFSDDTETVENTYDANGNLLTQDSLGGYITNSYDQLGNLLSTQNAAGGGVRSYGYDKARNETSATVYGNSSVNTFDASGVLTATTYPKGNGTADIHYATDDHGRRTDTWLAANTGNTTWAAHQVTSYDTSNRVGEVKAYEGPSSTSNTLLSDVQYCYNGAASTTTCSTATATDHSKLQWTKDVLTGQVTQYAYDTHGRLTSVTQSGGTAANNTTWTYTYDSRGNRLTAVASGATTSSQTLTYNAANQITTAGYSYDGAGNAIASPGGTATYNAAEQMTSTTNTSTHTTTTYTYQGASQTAVLTASTPGGNTYQTTYGKADPQGNPEISTYEVDNQYTEIGTIASDPVTGQPLLLSLTNGSDSLYIYDGLGNPTGVISDASTNQYTYSYDPYGTAVLTNQATGNQNLANPYLFKGGIKDIASGLVKFGLRWYNPVTGAWTQQDTLDAPLDPANGNRYGYAGGDPVNGIDPSGQASGLYCTINKGITAVAGAIAGGAALYAAVTAPADVFLAPAANTAAALGVAAVAGAVAGLSGLNEFLVGC